MRGTECRLGDLAEAPGAVGFVTQVSKRCARGEMVGESLSSHITVLGGDAGRG